MLVAVEPIPALQHGGEPRRGRARPSIHTQTQQSIHKTQLLLKKQDFVFRVWTSWASWKRLTWYLSFFSSTALLAKSTQKSHKLAYSSLGWRFGSLDGVFFSWDDVFVSSGRICFIHWISLCALKQASNGICPILTTNRSKCFNVWWGFSASGGLHTALKCFPSFQLYHLNINRHVTSSNPFHKIFWHIICFSIWIHSDPLLSMFVKDRRGSDMVNA